MSMCTIGFHPATGTSASVPSCRTRQASTRDVRMCQRLVVDEMISKYLEGRELACKFRPRPYYCILDSRTILRSIAHPLVGYRRFLQDFVHPIGSPSRHTRFLRNRIASRADTCVAASSIGNLYVGSRFDGSSRALYGDRSVCGG